MKNLKLPFDKAKIEEIIKKYPTPFHIYDEKGIIDSVKRMYKAFAWAPNFKNFFAVKALPSPSILKLLHKYGCGADCSSLAELELCEMAGIKGLDIMFTSNQTPYKEYARAIELGGIVNLDDITHIAYLEKHCGLPERLSFRYNPGALKAGNDIIGKPEEAKYGLTAEQIVEAFKIVKSKGVKYIGLHTMVASNELNEDYFVETAEILFQLAAKATKEAGITLEFINLGGGIGIPYKPDQKNVDLEYIGSKIEKLYNEILVGAGLKPNIYMECGRVIAGPYGYLVTQALHEKHTYRDYIGVDANTANLMRPALYGAYHHVTVLGKEDAPADHVYDVVGSLCENNDKLAIQRKLPKITIGDILVVHDTGAHGHSMGYNYNGKLRSAEILLHTDNSFEMIRRAETLEDLFATLKF